MPKIAFYTSGDCYGGLEKNTLRFIEWLNEDAHNKISLLTIPDSRISERAKEKNISTHLMAKPSYYIDLWKARALSHFLKQEGFVLMVVIRPRDILMASLVKNLFFHKLRLLYFQQSFLHLKKHLLLYKFLFRPFDTWIAPSEFLAAQNQKLTGYPPDRMIVIPPCIDADYFARDTLTQLSARKILDLPSGKMIVGVIGKYQNTYSLDFYIRMIQFLKRNKHTIHLLILGRSDSKMEAKYRDFLNYLAHECKVEDRIHFSSGHEKLVTFFRSINIFATNKLLKPYDMILQKAMASGLPVVAPFSKLNTEILERGKLGMLYHKNDLADFSSKIIHLSSQPKLRKHLETVGREAVFSKYDRHPGCEKVNQQLNKLTDLA